jgi:type IX secretion system PorP/SprF family membrane protein
MRKHLLLLSLLAGSSLFSWAQTDPLYAQYLNNPLLINPAYTGLTNNLNASVMYRKQWAGFDGSPTTFNANAHVSLRDNRMGVGLIIMKDQVGSNSTTEVQATYSYKLDLDEKYLSFGLQAGLTNYRSDNGDLNPYHPQDPAFNGNMSVAKGSFGAGAILHSDKYFIGISMPRMLKAKDSFDSLETQLYTQHLYMMGAYIFYVNEHIRLKPSVLLKGVAGAKLSADVNFSANLNEKYTVGVFTRNLNTYGLLAQMKIGDRYRFGYVFEIPTNNSVGARFTSHELTFGINMAIFKFHDSLAVNNF